MDLTTGQDLNTLLEIGVKYLARSGSIGSSLVHRPADLISACVVVNITYNTQILITMWAEFFMYKRTFDNGWGKWYKVTGTMVEYAT